MALTPLDIYNKEFKNAWKGYNRDQVDEFLDQVIIDFKSLLEGDGEVKTSPDEVRLKRFGRATRGYDADDVDAFLLDVAHEFAELLGQRRRAEEAARARKAGLTVHPAPAPEPAVPAPEPAVPAPEPAVPAPEPAVPAPEPAAPAPEPAAPAPEPAVPAPEPVATPAPSRAASMTGLPVEIPAGNGIIRLSLSGGRVFFTLEAQDLTVRKELDPATARRLGESLLRLTDMLGL
ncbi:MAG TPA: DivIVA domain-containing protein [Symbiobacteriaceae bacterium]|nr:DivIVA domain-containing protein [Symbiobacteriaceae bacterium]